MENKLKYLMGMSLMMLPMTANATEIATNAALMQAMDKITGRVNKITVPVNSKVTFGDFSLVLRDCKKRPAEETPENFAFIDVADKSFGTDEYNIFRGWIVSSTPGINAIEHPIYDVWLLECIDTDVDKSKLMTTEEMEERNKLLPKSEIKMTDNSVTKKEEDIKPKVIHIKEFVLEDNDIEKNIVAPEIQSNENLNKENTPKNLLEINATKEQQNDEDDTLSSTIDEEIEELQKY